MYRDPNKKLVGGQTTLVQYRIKFEQESMEQTRLWLVESARMAMFI